MEYAIVSGRIRFRLVHGCSCIAYQLLRRLISPGPVCYTYACGKWDLEALDFDTSPDFLFCPLCGPDRGPAVLESIEQQPELVAADPGDGIGTPEFGFEKAGDFEQKLIGQFPTECFVDGFETVDIDEDQRKLKIRFPTAPIPALGEPVKEARAVGEVCKGIAEEVLLPFAFEFFSFTDVTGIDDDSLYRFVLDQVCREPFQIGPVALSTDSAELEIW
jgi:hypothetical protein